MDAQKLVELKERLVKATTFSDVYEFFFEHFGNDPTLQAGGQKTQDLIIDEVIKLGFQQYAKDAKTNNRVLFRLPRYMMIHGIAQGSHGLVAIILFFEDINMGMLAIGKEISGPNMFVRFRTIMLDGKRTFQLN